MDFKQLIMTTENKLKNETKGLEQEVNKNKRDGNEKMSKISNDNQDRLGRVNSQLSNVERSLEMVEGRNEVL